MNPLLHAQSLRKSYGAAMVLRDVDFGLRAGEVHALVGENGAGKSTLCKIIGGAIGADSGSMSMNHQPFNPRSRRDAEHAGVRMVMQELNLIATLTVAENIFFDALPRRFGCLVNYPRMNARAAQILENIGLKWVRPAQRVGALSVGQGQLVEIAAALSRNCRVLILDEPTAALTHEEIELLFAHIERLKSSGVGIIYVSHRMEEIRRIADRITVLRDGAKVGTHATRDVTHQQIVRMMVGRDLTETSTTTAPLRGPIALSVRNLQRPPLVRDVSFDVHQGEILGFAGLMGSGRTETMRAIFGADRPAGGEIYLYGSKTPTRIRSPRQAVRHGIALLTEDRKDQGLLLPLSITHNATLATMPLVSVAHTWINRAREGDKAHDFAHALWLRCRSIHQPVVQLSGGNQQKVVLSKWLLRDSSILMFDEPTRGIDVGAKFEIYKLMRDLAARGKALIVVSSDLPELMHLCDRIAVMSAGKLVRAFDRGEWTQDLIMHAALSEYQIRETEGAVA